MYYSITNSGFPHSEIPGSKFTYNSPRHIGVSPVLHQLLVPRHPPCALVHLTKPTILISLKLLATSIHPVLHGRSPYVTVASAFYMMSLIILLLFSFQGT